MERCAAVLGTGRLGSAMARRLASAGFNVVLWNRTRSRAEQLAEEIGARLAASPREAAEACPGSVHLVVSDDHASGSVLSGARGVYEAGARVTVYNHSTVTVEHSLSMLAEAEARGHVYVEAPVAGGPRQALEGRLLVLCSAHGGCPASPSLEALGEVVDMGPPPRAVAAKLAFNISFLGVVASLGEAFAVAEAYGVDSRELIEKVLSKTWIRVILERYGERLWPRGVASFEARWAGKDARYAAEALQRMGLPGFLASSVAAYYALMTGEGLGGEDYPAIAGFLARYAAGRRSGGSS